MNNRLKVFMIPPLFEDEEQSAAARMTHFISLGLIVGILVVMLVHAITDPDLYVVLVLCVQEAFVLYAFRLNRTGSHKTALYVLVFSLLAMATFMLFLSGNGYHDNALLIYPSTLVVASLLLDRKFFVTYTITTVMLIAIVVFAEVAGILVNKMSVFTTPQDFVDTAIILFLTAIIVGLLTGNLRASLAKTQHNEQALATTNAELERQAQHFRESEERFRVTFEQAAVGISHVDTGGKFIRVNQRWCDILGYSREELSQMTFTEITHPDHLQSDQQDAERLFAGQIENYSKEKRYIRKNGSPVWVNLTVALVKDLNGRPTYSISVIEDISARKRVEEEVRTLNEVLELRVLQRTAELQAANRELESFSYSVSHDLRAPLRHISGYLELLKEEGGPSFDETSRRYLETAANSAVRLGILIDDLLAFSRVGRAEVKKSVVDIHQLVEELKVDLEGESKGRKIEWVTGSMPSVHADPTLLRQVMMNLMSNAVKFTKNREKARIEIGSLLQHDADNWVTLYVRDNGAGFDMKYVEKLFGVFQRLHRSDEFEGTGIGLANVRRIIQRHGGRTWAEGIVDQGATVLFTLPRDNNR